MTLNGGERVEAMLGWADDLVDRHRDPTVGVSAGDTINWRKPIAPDSSMDAFVIVEPLSLEPGSEIVHLADDDHLQLLQAVPVYSSELPYVRDVGAERLFGATR